MIVFVSQAAFDEDVIAPTEKQYYSFTELALKHTFSVFYKLSKMSYRSRLDDNIRRSYRKK